MDGLLPRGPEAQAHEHMMAEVRRTALLNTARHVTLNLGGWVVGLCATAVACWALYDLHNRPVMPPEMHIALVYPDRQPVPVLRERLGEDQRQIVLENSLQNYVRCREEYVWAAMKRCYTHVSVMSQEDTREKYQKWINDLQNPESPQIKYGVGLNSGTARIVGDIAIHTDPRQPNQMSFSYTLVEERAGKPTVARPRITRLVWDDASGKLPFDLQQNYTPLGVQVTWYVTDPDPARKGGTSP